MIKDQVPKGLLDHNNFCSYRCLFFNSSTALFNVKQDKQTMFLAMLKAYEKTWTFL